MKDKTNFLKAKDSLLKTISLCGVFYALSAFILIVLGIAYSQSLNNENLKNSVIVFGVTSLVIYLTQLISSLYVAIQFKRLLKSINWTNSHTIENTCWINVLVVALFIGFTCFPFVLKIKKMTMDISNAYLTTKLNTLVTFDMPYDRNKFEDQTNLLNAESYNFEIPLDITNMDQETPKTNK